MYYLMFKETLRRLAAQLVKRLGAEPCNAQPTREGILFTTQTNN